MFKYVSPDGKSVAVAAAPPGDGWVEVGDKEFAEADEAIRQHDHVEDDFNPQAQAQVDALKVAAKELVDLGMSAESAAAITGIRPAPVKAQKARS